MDRDRGLEIKVGLFVILSILMFGFVVLLLGSEENLFEENYVLHASFADISGLREGASIRLAGLDVGVVTRIEFPPDIAEKQVYVHMRVAVRFEERIRKDTIARISTQGVLGDKYISLSLGSPDQPIHRYDAWLQSEDPRDLLDGVEEIKINILGITRSLDDMLKGDKGDSSMKSLAEIIDSIRNILKEVEEGRGIVHTLVYDRSVSDKLKSALVSVDAVASDVAVLTSEIRTGDGTLHALIYEDHLAGVIASLDLALTDIDAVIVEIKEGDGTLHDLIYTDEGRNLIANLTDASADIRQMTSDIRAGHGTLGALLQDPTIYEDVKTLLGGAKRNKILRSYVRETIRKNERSEGLSDGGATRP
jgi:phospholipid/cholesterol/gamma-HCH transport system substrate-binding protein